MSSLASLTSGIIGFLEILHTPHGDQNPITKQIVSATLAQVLSNLAKAAPTDAKSLLDGEMINENSLNEVYGLVVKQIGQDEAKKILTQSLIEQEKIQDFVQESTLSAVFDTPKAFFDFLSE